MKPKNGFKTSSHEDAFKIMQNTTKKHPFFYSTVTHFAKFFGLSGSMPLSTLI